MSGGKADSTGVSPNEQAFVKQNGQCSKKSPECEPEFLEVCVSGDCSFSNRAAGNCCSPSTVHISIHPKVGMVCLNTMRETDGASVANRTAKIASHMDTRRRL